MLACVNLTGELVKKDSWALSDADTVCLGWSLRASFWNKFPGYPDGLHTTCERH